MARICIIEDDPNQKYLLQRLLEYEGHSVIPIDEPGLLIETLLAIQPDLILMDVALPGTDGISLSRKIRGCCEFDLIPILVVTAVSENEVRRAATAVGINNVISKPMTKDELCKAINEELKNIGPLSTR